MGRTKNTPAVGTELAPVAKSHTATVEAGQLVTHEQNERVAALANKLGYKGSLSHEALLDGARGTKLRLGMAIMEFGAYLLLIKEGSDHGTFQKALEELEIVPDTARTYMAITRRFAKRATSPVLESLGFSKAAELLPLDDEQIDELAEVGKTGELALDDVSRMSVKELRKAVRKERDVKRRLEAVNKEQQAEIVQLKLDKKVVALTDWPDALKTVDDQVTAAARKLATALSELETCRITISEAAQKLGENERPAFEAALVHVADVYEEALARAERGIERERVPERGACAWFMRGKEDTRVIRDGRITFVHPQTGKSELYNLQPWAKEFANGQKVRVSPLLLGDGLLRVEFDRLGQDPLHADVAPEREFDAFGRPLANAVLGEEYKGVPHTAAQEAAKRIAGAAYGEGISLDDAERLKAKGARPFQHFNGGKGVVAHTHLGKSEQPTRLLPEAVPIKTADLAALRAKHAVAVLSHFEAARELVALGVAMNPERVALLRAWHPDGAPEAELTAIAQRLTVRAGLRVIAGGSS
ncbi:MAG: hypothetical protein FWG56_00765 [Desulfovibrionaceae bacterium]|nr:hypothetical protein [Desulfovibrionaceae bacterium]